MSGHPRSGGNGDRSGFQFADDDSAFQHIHSLGGLDIALQFAADDDDAGQNLPGQVSAGFDAEITVDANIALEAASNFDVAGSLDLAFDRQIGGDYRFSALDPGSRGRTARRDGWRG